MLSKINRESDNKNPVQNKSVSFYQIRGSAQTPECSSRVHNAKNAPWVIDTAKTILKKNRMISKTKYDDEKNHDSRRQCGLCGKSGALTKTSCCGHWICDDYDRYEPFSFAQVSCQRNHERYTLCSQHFNERHQGEDWRSCDSCRWEINETEMYVWLGTNAFNFVTLKNPPAFDMTRCVKCSCVIRLGTDAYSRQGDTYACSRCFPLLMLGS